MALVTTATRPAPGVHWVCLTQTSKSPGGTVLSYEVKATQLSSGHHSLVKANNLSWVCPAHNTYLLSGCSVLIARVFITFRCLFFTLRLRQGCRIRLAAVMSGFHTPGMTHRLCTSLFPLSPSCIPAVWGAMAHSHLPLSHASWVQGLWSTCPRGSEKPAWKPEVRHWLSFVTQELNPPPAPQPGGSEKSCELRHGTSGQWFSLCLL